MTVEFELVIDHPPEGQNALSIKVRGQAIPRVEERISVEVDGKMYEGVVGLVAHDTVALNSTDEPKVEVYVDLDPPAAGEPTGRKPAKTQPAAQSLADDFPGNDAIAREGK